MEEFEEIRWTKRAVNDYINVVNYLQTNWKNKVTEEFEYKLAKTMANIKRYPKIGIVLSKTRSEYGFPVTKHN